MKVSDNAFAVVGASTGFAGLFAAAACCVLPLALAGMGVGVGGLALLGPLRAPLALIALLAVTAGWFLYFKRRRACAADATCEAPGRTTPILLFAASAFVILAGLWPYIEADIIAWFER